MFLIFSGMALGVAKDENRYIRMACKSNLIKVSLIERLSVLKVQQYIFFSILCTSFSQTFVLRDFLQVRLQYIYTKGSFVIYPFILRCLNGHRGIEEKYVRLKHFRKPKTNM